MRTKRIEIAVPAIDSFFFNNQVVSDVRRFISDLLLEAENFSRRAQSHRRLSFINKLTSRLPRFSKKKFPKIIVPIILLVSLFFIGRAVVNSVRGTDAQPVSNERVQVADALSRIDLNKTFTFPLRDATGEEVERFEYTIEGVELRDEIIVRGQRARAVEGRIFLTIDLKLVNSLNQPIELSSKDYIRLSVDGDESELLAPEIHNDPVEVQAISTKRTRVGYTLNEGADTYILIVGEIDGEKERIPLEF